MLNGASLDRELRKDIRQVIRKDEGQSGGGPDFHSPFWADAKDFVFRDANLGEATEDRIERNHNRERLYRLLQGGFLRWWAPFRAQRNEPIRPYQEELRGACLLPGANVEIKIQNLLSISAGTSYHRFIYPYFTEEPGLTTHSAEFALATLRAAFPDDDPDCFMVLDVLRGRGFSFEHTNVPDGAIEQFDARYQQILRRWELLRGEYR